MNQNFYSKKLSEKTSSFLAFALTLVTCWIMSFSAKAQVAVTGFANTTPPLAPTYTSLDLAINDLNLTTAISGQVIITLTGNEIAPAGGYSITAIPAGASALNNIIVQGVGSTITASPTLTAGNLNDAIFKLIGADFITIQNFTMQENAANLLTTAISNNMTEWGVALIYATTTNGAQNNTIQNNIISLNRTYQNTFGIYSNSTHSATAPTTSASATTTAGGNSGLKIYGNNISNVNNGIVVIGPTAAADFNTGVDIGGASVSTANTISNFGTTGTFSSYANVSGTVYGILMRNSIGFNISYNSITSSLGGVTSGTLRGIYNIAPSAASTGIFTNNINDNTIALTYGVATGTMQGITLETTNGTTTSSQNINNNNFTALTASIASSVTITAISTTATHLNTTINSNLFTNITTNTTGSFTFISQTFSNTNVTGTKTVNSNQIVTGFNKTGAGGTVLLVTDNGSSVTGVISNCQNNNFSNINVTGATTLTGLNYTDGGTAPTRTVSGNTLSNWTGGTSAINCMNFTYWNGVSSLSNNTISNITGQGAVTGITIGATINTATSITCASNTITNLTSTGTGGAVTGIVCSNTSPLININNNSISTLASTGASAVTGISRTGSSTTTNIFKNKICDISGSNASSTVNGILISTGTTVNVFNNLIGDLRTPAANAANPLVGINITGGTTINVVFNTVYINASSSGALFGSSAISVSITPTVTLGNNNFVNTSVSNGLALTVAYRRSAVGLGTYGPLSDRNNFFAPNIFTDGVNTFTTLGPGVGTYKNFVTPVDVNSISVSPVFLSTTCGNSNFLKINTSAPTLLESGGVNVAGITDDFENDIRQGNPGYAGTGTAPDIGADEFNGTVPPICQNTPAASSITGVASVCINTGTTLGLSTLYTDLGITYQWSSGTTLGGPYPITLGTGATQATGNLTVPTYYICTITCTNSGQTFTTTEKSVLINTLPPVTVSPTSGLICTPGGAAVTLTGGGALSYAWSPTSGLTPTNGSPLSANPSSTTIYTVTGTDVNGCTNTATASISVVAAPQNLTVSASPTSICTGSTSTLTASASIPGGIINVGTATTTIGGNNGNPYRSGNGVGNQIKTQMLYTATELTAAGMVAGNVLGLGFTCTSSTGTIINFEIRIGASSATLLTTTFETSPTTLVFTQSSFTPVAGLNMHTFNAGTFTWDGISNILVQTCQTNSILGTSTVSAYTPATVSNLSMQTSTTSCSSLTGTTVATKPIIRFDVLTPISNFTWQPGSLNGSPQVVSPTSTTIYTVTTDNGGCTATSTVSVSVVPLSCGAISATSPICAGSNFTLTSNALGGGQPYTYVWSNGSTNLLPTTANITQNLSAGTYTYTVTISDACGGGATCSSSITVIVNGLPSVSVSPTSGLICNPGGSAITLTANGALLYSWSPTSGLTPTNGSLVSANPSATTIYTLTGIDGNGCTSTSTSIISVGSIVTINSVSASPPTICSGNSSILIANVGAPLTYCTGSGGTIGCGAGTDEYIGNVTFNTINNTSTCPGALPMYEDYTSLSTTLAATIPYPISVLCPHWFSGDQFTVWIDLNHNGLFTDIGEQTTLTGATSSVVPATGTITIPITAYNGPTRMRVRVNYTEIVSPCGVIQYGEVEDYTVNITGATNEYNYAWTPSSFLSSTSTNPTTSTLPTASTTYSVSVTNAVGCSSSGTVSLTVNPAPVVTISSTNVSCFGGNNGSATANATGTPPFTYNWSNSSTASVTLGALKDNSIYANDASLSNGAGDKIISGTRSNGDVRRALVSFNTSGIPAGATITGVSLNLYCVNAPPGSNPQSFELHKLLEDWGEGTSNAPQDGAGISATPGDATWLNTFFPSLLWSTAGGNFTVAPSASTVVAGAGATYTWSAPGMIADVQSWITSPSSNFGWLLQGPETGPSLGRSFGSKENATPSFRPSLTITYSLGTSATINNLTAGTYTVTVTGVGGCTATSSVIITQPTAISITKVVTPASCSTAADGAINITVSGGTPGYIYLWSDNNTNEDRTGLLPGTYTVVVTDLNGCTSSSVTVLTFSDVTPPVINCPANATINCDAVGTANTGTATANDVCDPSPVITHTDATVAGNCSGNYTINRTWIATDNSGNSSTCIQAITVQDITPPTITCPSTITANCNAILPANTGTATATDNCTLNPVLQYSDATTAGNCPGNYTITRTWTATDDCGNSASCVQTITVQDVTPPVITCPANATINCDAVGTANTGSATASDNCDANPAITHNDVTTAGNCPGNYSIARTWTATDNCGNASSCVQTITVQDVTPPTITCPANATINCDAVGTANTGTATASDNCDNSPSISHSDATTAGNCPGNYTISRTWTATDNCGNASSCVQTITVQDVTPPTITCPANATINCDAVGTANTGVATASDNCDNAPAISHSDATTAGNCPGNYTISRTWTATDNCGNASSCIQTITVQDVTPPTITCPANATINCDAVGTANTGSATASDNCDANPAITHSDVITSGNCTGNYSIARTWTATDNCGNAVSCIQTITVQDITPPVITCPADITIGVNSPGGFACNINLGTPVTSDNCGSVTLVNNGVSCYPLGTSTVTWTATDDCGNSASCIQTITVVNSVSVNCSVINNVSCFGGSNGSVLVTGSGGTLPYTIVPNPTGLSAGTYTFVLTDALGATATCSSTITEPPAIIPTGVASNVTCKGAKDGTILMNPSGGSPGYTYLWNNGSVSANRSGLAPGTYTVIVTDSHGCTATASFTIVQSATSITINIVKTNVRCGGKCTGSATAAPVGGTPPYSLLWSNGQTTGTIGNLCAGTYTLTVTDAYHCVKSFSVNITSNPILVLTAVPSGPTQATATASGGIPGYTYYWSTVPPQTNATAILLVPGSTYKVRVTDSKGCSKTTTVTMPTPKGSAITTGVSLFDVSVYPNPTSGNITLDFNDMSSAFKYSLKLYDLTGRVLFNENANKVSGVNTHELNFETLPKGIYTLSIQTDLGNELIKIVLQ